MKSARTLCAYHWLKQVNKTAWLHSLMSTGNTSRRTRKQNTRRTLAHWSQMMCGMTSLTWSSTLFLLGQCT
ncbi:hypothetical protein BS17DRAFT_790983, partial [Gyrodon lividus]